jgi:hypothetical protein
LDQTPSPLERRSLPSFEVQFVSLFYRRYGRRGTRLVDHVLIHTSGPYCAGTGPVYNFQLLALDALWVLGLIRWRGLLWILQHLITKCAGLEAPRLRSSV